MVLKLEISDILPTSGIKITMSIINSILGYRIGYIIVPIQLHSTPRGVKMTSVGVFVEED